MKSWSHNNQIKLISSGEVFFDSIEKSIRQAKREIFFETYIFSLDKIGRRIFSALIDASKRGVKTHLVIDGIGSLDFPDSAAQEFIDAGGKFHRYNPPRLIFSVGLKIFRRMHRKNISIDATEAFVGGMNIHDDQLKELDFTVQIQGPLASRIFRFQKLFFLQIKNRWIEYFKELSQRKKYRRPEASSETTVSADFLVRDNFRHRRKIERAYVDAMAKAKRTIDIANAYFIPAYRFRRTLRKAAARGVKVRLILQGKTDAAIVKWATPSLYSELIKAGIEIYEYHSKVLHGKVAIVDSHWATVGSANLDIFSLFLSLEANIVLRSEKIAREIENKLNTEIENGAKLITPHFLKKRTLFEKVRSYLALKVLKVIQMIAITDYQ